MQRQGASRASSEVIQEPLSLFKASNFSNKTIVRTTTLQKCGVNYFSVLLCPGCREVGPEFLMKFSVWRISQDLGARIGKKFTQSSRQKRCEKTGFKRKFALLGGGADFLVGRLSKTRK